MEITLTRAPATLVQPRRSIEDFRGNFEDLALFMQRSWAENKSQPLLYMPEYIASCFAYPGASFGLAPTLYEDSRIVGFIAGFPRRVKYQGKTLRIIVVSFLTVASEHKKSGYGMVLWSELAKRARGLGFDGAMNYCVDGDSMNGMMLGCYQRMRVSAARIFSVQYLTRLIMPRGITGELGVPDQGLVASFMLAASRTAEAIPLARVWTLEEAEWQCRRRANSILVTYSSGERRGFVSGYILPVADRDRTKCLLIDDVLWNDLTVHERPVLAQKLVERAASSGARMAVVPLQGYADPEPFLKSRFLRSPRVLHAYMGLWNAELKPELVSSFYVDVF